MIGVVPRPSRQRRTASTWDRRSPSRTEATIGVSGNAGPQWTEEDPATVESPRRRGVPPATGPVHAHVFVCRRRKARQSGQSWFGPLTTRSGRTQRESNVLRPKCLAHPADTPVSPHRPRKKRPPHGGRFLRVEDDGIEPTTSGLQSRRSPS